MKKGVTLVELIVVVGIISLMSSMVTIGIIQSRQKSRDAVRVADINLIAQKIQKHYNDNYAYPASLSALGTVPTDPQGGFYKYTVDNAANPPYFELYANMERPGSANIKAGSDYRYCISLDINGASKTCGGTVWP